jgi:tetratricopeptide (TPR) repeat protein
MRLASAAASVALVLFAYAPAHAQAVTAAMPPADDMEAAKAHFAAGSAYYEQADYTDAVKEFNEAYRLSKRTDLLYNIAVCYERLNDYDNAIATLKRYLIEKPNAPDRVTIESRIQNLQKAKEAQPAPGKPVPAPAPKPIASPVSTVSAPATRSERPARWWLTGTVIGAAGAAVLAGSLGTGLAAHSLYQDLSKKCQNQSCPPDRNLENEQSRGRALGIASDVLLGVGIAAVATGVVLLIVKSRHHPTAVRQAWLAPSLRGLAVRF